MSAGTTPVDLSEFRHKADALNDFAKLLRDANTVAFPLTGDAEIDRNGTAMAAAMRSQTENAACFAERLAAINMAASEGLLS